MSDISKNIAIKGRGTNLRPRNRFEEISIEHDPDWLEDNQDVKPTTQYFKDHSKSILAKNDSPDLAFTYSVNPYRGCEHGCVYCYARPTHEYLGFSSGLDFETKIIIKPNAPDLLSQKFKSKSWKPQAIVFSGNTDCYQPIEKKLKLTRACLKVFLLHRNPVGLITKNSLILRDLDILKELAAKQLIAVTISITSLNPQLSRVLEPRTSSPKMRLKTVAKLVEAGIPTNVNVAPIIPGLNEHEVPQILKEVSDLGVQSAHYIILRLPYAIKELFQNWLTAHFPDRKNKIINTVKETRAGKFYDPTFGTRMAGEGVRAELIAKMFKLNCGRLYLNQKKFNLSADFFIRNPSGQTELFTS